MPQSDQWPQDYLRRFYSFPSMWRYVVLGFGIALLIVVILL